MMMAFRVRPGCCKTLGAPCTVCSGSTYASITFAISGVVDSTSPRGPGGGGAPNCVGCASQFNASWELPQSTMTGLQCLFYLPPDSNPTDYPVTCSNGLNTFQYTLAHQLFTAPYNFYAGGIDTTIHVFLQLQIFGVGNVEWDYDLGAGTTVDCTTINGIQIMFPGNMGAAPAFGTGPGFGGWDDGCTDFSNCSITATANY